MVLRAYLFTAFGAFLALIPNVCAQPQNVASAPLTVLPVQGSIYAIFGPGGNITVQVGKDGVLLVDTMYAELAPRIAAEIKKITDRPIRYIINTHFHADHTGGNAALAAMGTTGASPIDGGGPTIIAADAVVNRMTAQLKDRQAPARNLPNDEYSWPTKDLYFNGEAVIVFHEPKAHTDGDSMVFFRRSDVLSTGDIFTPERYPFLDIANGGSVQGEIDALNHILRLTVPARLQEGGTKVVPGHGRLCDEADVVEYREMVTIIRDRVQDMIKSGKTLAEVKAARPSLDYDTRYGSGDAFVEAVYKSLGGK
jgi:glyoxylase-like metal-dependent hydrolase (beta-lactamase superfamily II)